MRADARGDARADARALCEALESRLHLWGGATASVIDGDLWIRSDVGATEILVDSAGLQAGQVRITPTHLGWINGEGAPLVVDGVTGSIYIHLGDGNDRVTLSGLSVAGSVRMAGGRGHDTLIIEQTTIGGDLLVKGQRGHDSITLDGVSVAGAARIFGGDGHDVFTLIDTHLDGGLELRGNRGDDTLAQDGLTHGGVLDVRMGPGQNLFGQTPIRLSFDFAHGEQGWHAGFADYPRQGASRYALSARMRPMPAETGLGTDGYRISGRNHSDDLFMYLMRRLDTRHGIEAGRQYQISIDIEYASNAPSNCVGIGGAPGESVVMKAGASGAKPRSVTVDGYYQMTIDKDNQWGSGIHASVAGHIANGVDCEEIDWSAGPDYVMKRQRHVHTHRVKAGEDGRLYLIVGTDSGFEGTTTLFYSSINVVLTPVA